MPARPAALGLALAALAAAACGSGSAPSPPGAALGRCPDFRRVAAPASSVRAAPPIEHRRLAFTRPNGVYLGRSDGTRIRRLTRLPGFEYQPDWSPDGSQLLLRVDGDTFDDPRAGVHIVDRDGKRARNLTDRLGVRGGSPDWSPDGEHFAFMGKRDGEASWSPDGRWLAFNCPQGACAARADGTQRHVILAGLDAGFPAWDPAGGPG